MNKKLVIIAVIILLLGLSGRYLLRSQFKKIADTEKEAPIGGSNYAITEEEIYDGYDEYGNYYKAIYPNVSHQKNLEISNYFSKIINLEKAFLTDIHYDFSFMSGPVTINTYNVTNKGNLVSVNIFSYSSYDEVISEEVYGMVFDSDGKIYSNDEILEAYGTSYEEIEEAISEVIDEDDIFEIYDTYNENNICILNEKEFLLAVQKMTDTGISYIKIIKFTVRENGTSAEIYEVPEDMFKAS